jgi:septal ring factor EnvC (AmiA/AmiB activator)
MGWPSTYEDILERMSIALEQLRDDVPENLSSATDSHRRAIDHSLAALFAIIKEAQSCLELGTDPSLNLAVELHHAQQAIEALRIKLAESEKSNMKLGEKLVSASKAIDSARNEVKQLKVERNSANNKLEELLRSNPGAAYDLYKKAPRSER